jgi:hypothetical protein
MVIYHPWAHVSLHRCCPRCGDPAVTRRRKGDSLEGLYRNPISLMQALLFAPLWYCYRCRLHFFDLRPGVQAGSEPDEAGDPSPRKDGK